MIKFNHGFSQMITDVWVDFLEKIQKIKATKMILMAFYTVDL